ncbi:unnamed protein product, partial [marine sediment metagenome]
GSRPLIKGVLLVPEEGNPVNPPNTIELSELCSGTAAQVQGLIYTERTYQAIGFIYGYIYADKTTGLRICKGRLFDVVPYNSGDVNPVDELPLDVRGLYRLTEGDPIYD